MYFPCFHFHPSFISSPKSELGLILGTAWCKSLISQRSQVQKGPDCTAQDQNQNAHMSSLLQLLHLAPRMPASLPGTILMYRHHHWQFLQLSYANSQFWINTQFSALLTDALLSEVLSTCFRDESCIHITNEITTFRAFVYSGLLRCQQGCKNQFGVGRSQPSRSPEASDCSCAFEGFSF